MLLIDRRASRLSFHELGQLVDHLAREGSPKLPAYAVRYYGLLADVVGPLIVIAIAIPFAVSGVRVNPAVGVSGRIVPARSRCPPRSDENVTASCSTAIVLNRSGAQHFRNGIHQ